MFTYETLAEKLIDLTGIDWQEREDQRNTCRYGLEMLTAFLANCFLLFFLGIFSGMLREVCIYLAAWGSLRLFAGGRHAKNHLNCIVSFTTVMLLVIWSGQYLVTFAQVKAVILVCMIIGFVVNGIYAGGYRKDKKEMVKNKKRTLIVWCIQFLAILSFFCQKPLRMQVLYEMFLVSGAVLAESFFLLPKVNKKNSQEKYPESMERN